MDWQEAFNSSKELMVMMLINGLSYHFQTMMAWVLMSFVSPVTHR
jgi:hypothetical protein